MEEVPITGQAEDNLFKRVLGSYDVPAYVRRARAVEDAFHDLLSQCRLRRTQMLELARSRLQALRDLVAGDWQSVLLPLATREQADVLQRLQEELQPSCSPLNVQAPSHRVVRRALLELVESLEWFNRRWIEYLDKLDLTSINELRDKYNRYYLVEKECAVRSARVARQGFVRMNRLSHEELREAFPVLPIPAVA